MSSLTVKALPREFILVKGSNKVRLPDPNINLTPSEVMNFYSGTYPEMTNSSCGQPQVKSNKVIYEISTTVGKKG